MHYLYTHLFSILNTALLLGLVVIFMLLYSRLGKLIDQRLTKPLQEGMKQAVKESEIDTNLKALGMAEQALKVNGSSPTQAESYSENRRAKLTNKPS